MKPMKTLDPKMLDTEPRGRAAGVARHATRACGGWAAVAAIMGSMLGGPGRSTQAAIPAADPAYAFAQQKIYGMTLTPVPGGNALLVGDTTGFAVKMSTAASVDTLPGIGGHVGGLDALQTYVGGTLPAVAPENYSGNAPAGYAIPVGERVLLQWNPTGLGAAKSITSGIPVAGDFRSGDNFARADGYVTPNPDVLPVGAGSGTTPADIPPGTWPPGGSLVAIQHLFAPIGSPDTLSVDLVAETLLTDVQHGSISDGVSDWSVAGRFSIVGGPDDRVGVSLDFNVIERMAVYSSTPLTNYAVASNAFAFDVLDSRGESVFDGVLGTNPSTTRLLSTASVGAVTYNNNTKVPTHVYPGASVAVFQTEPLPPGLYSFSIKGTTTAYVSLLPEPGMNAAIMIMIAAAVGGRCLVRRRHPPQPLVPAPRT